MRYPEGHKEAVRASIVKNASRALRRDGISGVSIPALMKKAGLTHGGFYAHFKNRDELVAAAVLSAADETGAAVLSSASGDLQGTLSSYLSKEHAEHPERGCVIAALGGEGRRQPAVVRRAFAHAARGFIRLVASRLQGDEPASGEPSNEALRLASQMIGAVVLARLVDEPALSARLLEAAKSPPRE
ncbi:MAG TPA: TetR/AcrR family transcriptional regulator [Polyangiaceae bacterium]|nr:TetR/AcrR family transcriptional regulator [Polyangiaceae bacterium]